MLEHVIVACGPLLEILWAAHRAPTDFLILGDVRRPECNSHQAEWWGDLSVVGAKSLADRPGAEFIALPYIQDGRAIDAMLVDGDPAHEATGRELRHFQAGVEFGGVPLLVVFVFGLRATLWAAPGFNLAVSRQML